MWGGRGGFFSFILALLCAAAFQTAPATAQTWPQRPVKFIITLGPGSGADIGARLLSDRLSKKWGQPVVIENRPGGDGVVAINAFVSAHDDHVLLFGPSSSFIAHPYLYANLSYKPSDLATIARVSNTIVTISVPKDFPVNSVPELVALAQKKPGELNWAGLTGALDFMFSAWLKSNNLDLKKVPYRNPVDAANDLAVGRVQVYEAAYAIVRPRLQNNQLKVLAVTNSARAPVLPDVPTVKEAGYPSLELDGLVGLFGPPSMPMALRERIAADIKSILDNDQIVRDRLVSTGQTINPGGPAEFAAAIEDQRAKMAAAVKVLGVKAKQ